jgi:Protein of unknown function (DUF1652)
MTMAAQTQERVLAVLETAFLPLEAHASLEEGDRVQVRILDGAEAIHIEERPLSELRSDQDVQGWIEQLRRRLGELGYDLKEWKLPEGGSGRV